MKTFSSQSGSTGNVITSLASKAALAVGAFVSIRSAVNFGKDVINTGMEFEQGMANVSAISGATGAELSALSEKAKQMGATTKFSAIEASEAMSYMAMAGWNSSQMIDGISGIMNLAAASGEDLASVSDIVTDSLTAFGLKASDSSEFADILAVASSSANTNVSMLGESFKNVAPVAGAMGYSVRDTTVALSLMANAGIKGSDAGTSLRSVMTRLAKPTADVSKALTALNVEVTATDGSMKPLSQLIPELQSKFAGLSESERGQYATMIAGKNAMSGFLSIVNSSSEDFEALTAAINDSDGAAQKMADTMNDTVSGKLTLLKSQFEGVKIAIFDALGSSQFKGVLQSMSDGLGAITPYVTTLTVAIGNGLFSAIQTIYNIGVTVFNAVKSAIENNQPAIDRLRSAFENIKTRIVNAFSGNGTALIQTLADVIIPSLCNSLALAMNIASGVISVVSALSPLSAGIAGAVMAYKVAVTAANVVEGIRNGLIAFSAVMTGTQAAAFAPLTTATIAQIAATSALNVVTGVFGAIMTFVTSPIGLVVLAIGAVIAVGVLLYKHWDQVKEWAMNLWNGIKNVFNGIKDAISNAWNKVKETASNVWNGIKDTVSSKIEGIKSAVSEKFNAVKSAMGSVLENAKGVVSEKLNNIKSAYEEHGGGIAGVAAGAMEAIKGYYTAGYDFINNLTGGKLGQVVDGVKQKLSPMVDAVKDKLSGLKDAFANGFSNAFN
ncbi:MAG: phage tail tape measure protein, partial [Clostridia bacterium]|nr:phage tail tape measure protein [Clostridia bacterium]